MQQSDRSLITHLKNATFRMLVQQLKAEQGMSDREFQILLLANLLIQAAACCYNLDMFAVTQTRLQSASLVTLCVVSLITVALAGLLTLAMSLTLKSKTRKNLPWVVFLATRSLHAFKLFVFPLLVWSMTFTYLFPDGDLQVLVALCVGIPSFLIGLTLMIFSTLFLKSTIPSKSPFGCMVPKHSLFNHLLLNGIIALGVASKARYLGNNRLYLQAVILVVSVLLLSFAIFNPPYWRSESNRSFLTFLTALAMIMVWNLVVSLSSTRDIHWVSLVLVLAFSARVADAIVKFQDQLDIFEESVSSIAKLRGLLLITNLFNKSWKGELTSTETMELYELKLKFKEVSGKRNKTKVQTVDHCQNIGTLSQFLAEESEKYPKSIDMAKFELLGRLMDPIQDVSRTFSALARYKKSIGGGWIESLEELFLHYLFESRLKSLYWLPPQERQTIVTPVQSLFSDSMLQDLRRKSTTVLDICVPLNHKTLFLDMKDLICDAVNERFQIYKYINGKANSAGSLMSIDLYHLNNKAKASLDKATKFIKENFDHLKFPPSYFYPPLFIINAMMLHDTLKARKIMRTFKKNVQMLEILKSKEAAQTVSESLHMYWATIQVSLQTSNRGEILNLTPNWEEVLGVPAKKKDAIGLNVNELMIDSFSERHSLMMRDTSRLKNILTLNREFFIKTFAKELKPVTFSMRLWPSLEKDLTGVVAIGPSASTKQGLALILLTPEMDIINAENSFWQNMGITEDGEVMSSILQYSLKFKLAMQILGIFEVFIKEAEKINIQKESQSLLSTFYQFSRLILAFNQNCNLVYHPDSETSFSKELKGTNLRAKLATFKFADILIHQLFVNHGTTASAVMQMNKKFMEDDNDLREGRKPTDGNNIHTTTGDAKKLDTHDEIEEFTKVSSMNIRETIKFWEEQEKPVDVDLVLLKLHHFLDSINETELTLCPEPLKKCLEQLQAIAYQTVDSESPQIPQIKPSLTLPIPSKSKMSELNAFDDSKLENKKLPFTKFETIQPDDDNEDNDENRKRGKPPKLVPLSKTEKTVKPGLLSLSGEKRDEADSKVPMDNRSSLSDPRFLAKPEEIDSNLKQPVAQGKQILTSSKTQPTGPKKKGFFGKVITSVSQFRLFNLNKKIRVNEEAKLSSDSKRAKVGLSYSRI